MSWENVKGLARDWLIAIGLVVVLWMLWVTFMAPRAISEGPAPDFVLVDLAGQEVRLSDHEHLVVLNFWFTTCPPCRHEIPELAAFHAAHPEVPLYGVSIDKMERSRLGATARRLGVTYPVLHDPNGSVAASYGIGLYPTTVVVHDGQIAAVRTGEVTQKSLEALIQSVHAH